MYPPAPAQLKETHKRQHAATSPGTWPALADEISQMLADKLGQMGHEPPNVQVLVQQGIDSSQAELRLQDHTGVFLEAAPGQDEESQQGSVKEEEDEPVTQTDKVEELRQQLQ